MNEKINKYCMSMDDERILKQPEGETTLLEYLRELEERIKCLEVAVSNLKYAVYENDI